MQGKESSVPRTVSRRKRKDRRAIAEYAVTEAKEERGLRRKI